MTMRVLWKDPVKPNLPQCEAIRQTPYANDTPERNKQCKWSARYRINGRNLCSKHAGQAALALLVETAQEKEAET